MPSSGFYKAGWLEICLHLTKLIIIYSINFFFAPVGGFSWMNKVKVCIALYVYIYTS